MSTHNIGFNEDLTKIIFELSSNTHLISSAGIQRKRSLRNQLELITGTGKVIKGTRILYRLGKARRILLKDASLMANQTPFDWIYRKAGGLRRAERDFLEMSLRDTYHVQLIEGDTGIIGQIGKYSVVFRKENPQHGPVPLPTITMAPPPLPRGRRKSIQIVYGHIRTFKIEKYVLSSGRLVH